VVDAFLHDLRDTRSEPATMLTLVLMKRYLISIDPYPVHPDIFIRQPCLGTSLSRGNPASRAININPGSTICTRSDSCSHRKKKKKKELNSLGLQLIFANVLLPTASPQFLRCGFQRENLESF
jgi:hypothetical protein